MNGTLFARTLKQNPELRHDFDAFLKEQRDNFSHELENNSSDVGIFNAQGKIRALDAIKSTLTDMMNLPAEENGVSRRS